MCEAVEQCSGKRRLALELRETLKFGGDVYYGGSVDVFIFFFFCIFFLGVNVWGNLESSREENIGLK